MNKNVTLPFVALIMVLAMVGAASAAETVDKVEIRGTMAEIVPAGLVATTWDAQSFAGFWYDIEKDTQSERLVLQALGAGINTIPKQTGLGTGLTYTAMMQGAEYKNPSLDLAAAPDYMILGWFAKKYVAVNNQPDVLSKIVLEMGGTAKKTLATGEAMDLGNGYTLIAKQIDLDGNKVWLSLEKNGVEVESSIITTGAIGASGDSFIDMNGVTLADTGDTFVYQTDIGSESDVPIFTVAITAVFRGTDTNVIQLKYAMLIDDELLEIESDYESHKMKVTSITANTVTMQNDETITLTEDSDIKIMGDIVFHVAEDKDGDGIQEYRFYPLVEKTIGGDGVEPVVVETAEPDVVATAKPDVVATAKPDVVATAKPEVVATAEPEAPAPAAEAPTKKPGVPGFEAVFAIAGLLAVAYLVLRQRE